MKNFLVLSVAAVLFLSTAPLHGQSDAPDITTLAGSDNGPGVLSRDSILGPDGSRKRLQIRPFAGVSGVYDTQLTDPTLLSNGSVPKVGAYGVEGQAGLTGSKAYRHGLIGVNYFGNYRDYVNGKFYNGTDQFLALQVRHELSKHLVLDVQQAAGSYARAFSGPGIGGYLDPSLINNPATDIFDSRTYYTSTDGNLLITTSPRLSFGIGGRGFVVRRNSPVLVGVNGYDAHGDAIYRLSRRATAGVYYRFTHYDFPRAFGADDLHTMGIEYAYRMTKHWTFSFQVGGSRLEAQMRKQVEIDPLIAAITGQYSGSVAIHKLNYLPDFNGRLAGEFRSGSLMVNYARRVNPGNGVYLTSQYETAGGMYTYTGVHHWNFGVDAGYDRYSSLTQTIGPYNGYRGGVGITRDLVRNFHATLRGDYRHYNVNYAFFRRDQTRITLGILWSPGELPLSLW